MVMMMLEVVYYLTYLGTNNTFPSVIAFLCEVRSHERLGRARGGRGRRTGPRLGRVNKVEPEFLG
jgi:hypothetical protein